MHMRVKVEMANLKRCIDVDDSLNSSYSQNSKVLKVNVEVLVPDMHWTIGQYIKSIAQTDLSGPQYRTKANQLQKDAMMKWLIFLRDLHTEVTKI